MTLHFPLFASLCGTTLSYILLAPETFYNVKTSCCQSSSSLLLMPVLLPMLWSHFSGTFFIVVFPTLVAQSVVFVSYLTRGCVVGCILYWLYLRQLLHFFSYLMYLSSFSDFFLTCPLLGCVVGRISGFLYIGL